MISRSLISSGDIFGHGQFVTHKTSFYKPTSYLGNGSTDTHVSEDEKAGESNKC